ncbi:MAG: hypothetical protein ACO1QS_12320 [Verrucomicrobiota bacterium]
MKPPRFQELDESIYDLIEQIRKKPGMYIGERSINRLHAFLVGYTAGIARTGFMLGGLEDFHRFHEWTAQQLGFTGSSAGWHNMIRERSTSEADAFDHFFKLLDQFRTASS